jgi:membrane protease YdiL (CAAX protease family)
MAILAATPPPDPRWEAIFAAACLLVGLGLVAGLRLFRPRKLDSPDRLPPRVSAWPLVAVMGAGLFFWYAIPVTYFGARQAALMAREGPDARIDPAHLSATDLAFVATVPPAGGLIALLLGDVALRRRFGIGLGFGPRRLGRGLVLGLLGSACVVPILYGFMVLVEWAYRRIGYEHPKEHDLLRALGESHDRATHVVLVIGAAVMAPVFEELLFRGHLQTILRRAFARGALRRAELTYAAPAAPDGPPRVLLYASPPPEPLLPPVPPAWASWAAILSTSALFALVHEPWTWPPIFLLSVCLGYAYERTGNLWVPVVIHAAFNSISTAMYVLGGGAN